MITIIIIITIVIDNSIFTTKTNVMYSVTQQAFITYKGQV